MKKSQAVKPITVYELLVTLEYVDPPVWRIVMVKDTTTLKKLHLILQAAMGWTNSHLHSFQRGEDIFAEPDPDGFLDYVIDEARIKLRDIIGVRQSMTYLYDYPIKIS